MRTYPSKGGPFTERPFYNAGDIESICATELQNLNLYPTSPSPIRIDRFIEKRFSLSPTYEDLPPGLLGFTRFGTNGVEEIVVAKVLDEDGSKPAERRLRTTLAHEVGHVLLHAHLFAFGVRPSSLFEDSLDGDVPRILCREGGVSGVGEGRSGKPPYRWWEFQANQAMGALLLPMALVEQALVSILTVQGSFGRSTLLPERREQGIRHLAGTFDVNPIVARIRLEALYPPESTRQLTL